MTHAKSTKTYLKLFWPPCDIIRILIYSIHLMFKSFEKYKEIPESWIGISQNYVILTHDLNLFRDMTNKLEDLFSYLMYHFVTHDSSYAHAVGLLCEKSVNENENSSGVSSTEQQIQMRLATPLH